MTSIDKTLLKSVLDASDCGLIVVGRDRGIILWNDWMERASRIARGDALGHSIVELFPDLAATRLIEAIDSALTQQLSSFLSPTLNKTLFPLRGLGRRADPSPPIQQLVLVGPVVAGSGESHCLIQIVDITKAAVRERLLRRQALTLEALAEESRRSELHTLAILENALDAIMTFAEQGAIVTCNPAAERIFGYRAGEVVGKPIADLFGRRPPAEDDGEAGLPWHRLAADGKVSECAGRRKDGSEVPLELSVGRMEIDGRTMFIAMARDISRRKEAEARIQYLAHFDGLTNLPNRVLFQERLSQAVRQAKRTGRRVALMVVDIDRFKDVNDTLGHHVGDLLLSAAAERISEAVRESDTVGRLGGDEFAVILTNLDGADGAGTVAESIVAALAKPFQLGGRQVRTSVSVGITLFPEDTQVVGDLLRNADLALYRSKAKGRNTYNFYVPEMDALVQAHMNIERELRQAMGEDRLGLHFQPLVDVASGKVRGAEALVRWNHARRGTIVAGDFIPIVERTGLIIQLGDWVIGRACAQAKAWQDAGLPAVLLSVNLSSAELRRRNLVKSVGDILGESGLDARYLQLEFGEHAFLSAVDANPRLIDELHELGVRVSIDDFGTGASSLDYLKRHPVDQLKIAPLFLYRATTTVNSDKLFKAMVDLGHSLGATIDVEGVETRDQLDFVIEQGVEEAQGFFICRPLGADDFGRLLSKGIAFGQ